MDRNRIRAAIEVTTNLAVLAMCVALAVVLMRGRTVTSPTSSPSDRTVNAVAKGDIFPSIGAFSYGQANQTLIMALNTQCRFCKESLPFYRKLLSSGHHAQIVALFPNRETEVRDYLQKEQLPMQEFAEVDFAKLQIHGTPTLVLVDRGGKVRSVWTGELSAGGEEEVLSTLSSGDSTRAN